MEREGIVIERLPNALYRVEMDNMDVKTCYLAGKMKLNRISVLVGDRVRVKLDMLGGTNTNRIIRRI